MYISLQLVILCFASLSVYSVTITRYYGMPRQPTGGHSQSLDVPSSHTSITTVEPS
jgi:hypothetical protein